MNLKYRHTQAQLTKLKNQIRIQLNKIRPYQEQINYQKQQKASKRLFKQKYSYTNLTQIPQDRTKNQYTPKKKYFDQKEIINLDQNKLRQRKHYQYSYLDKIDISSKLNRKTSSYFNIQPKQQNRQIHTSLLGVGKSDKSLSVRSKSGKRTFPSKSVLKFE